MLKRSMAEDAHNFNNIETRAFINDFPAKQDGEENSRHSDKHNGNMHHILPPSKPGGRV